MKLNKKVLFFFLVLLVIDPFQQYANWHLKSFSDGTMYTLLNFFYSPDDYKRPIWQGVLTKGEPLKADLSHKYKGLYDVYISGDAVKNKSIKFTINISCDTGELLQFTHENLLATDWLRENYNEIPLPSYNVTDTINSFKGCFIKYNSSNSDSQLFVSIIKHTHW